MRGLSLPIVAMIFVTATLAVMLGIFLLYSSYFSNVNYTVSSQSYVIGLSKLVQFQISTLAFYGIPQAYKYFNVSYLIWVSSPTKTVTLVIFNTTPSTPSLLYYTLPQGNMKSGLFKSQPQGYASLQSFTINSNVYLPTGDLLGVINARAYNISSNSTYVLSSIIKPNNVIVIWAMYYYQGKWYRLAWTYTAPMSQGLGLYVLTNSGIFGLANPQGANPPHYVTSNIGIMFGLWFKVLNTQANSIISNLSITKVGNNDNASIIVYIKSGGLYADVVVYTKNIVKTYTILQNLNQGAWYFLNISFGALVAQGNQIIINIYSPSQVLLNSISINKNDVSLTSLNGNISEVKFGSPLIAAVISQAFLVSLQSANAQSKFYNVSQTILMNGYYYNNTNNLKQIIINAQNDLYDIVYWNFVWASSTPPPPNIPAIMWYWPKGSGGLQTVYIYPTGQNTYTIA